MRTTRLAITILAAAALAGCQKTETPEQAAYRMNGEAAAARPAIDAQTAAYGQHFSAGHADSVVAIHTDDAWEMPPNGPATHGADALRQMFTAQFQQAAGGTLALRNEHLDVNGPMALTRGRYNFAAPAGSPIPADSGKYLTHWQLVAGQWRISQVIWNSDVPLPTPAAPPARRR
jgi:ketosteroid isomerase-like protein